jgi:hypothetical protein
MDFVYLSICIAFFVASTGLVRLCAKLGGE